MTLPTPGSNEQYSTTRNNTNLTLIDSELQSQDGRLDLVEGRATTAEGNITTLQADVETLQDRVTARPADLTALAALPTGELLAGDLARVTALNVLFVWSGSAWAQSTAASIATTATRDTEYAKASAAYRVSGVYCLDSSTGILWRYNGTAWQGWSSPWIAYTPTLTGTAVGTGGSASNSAEYKFTDGELRIRGRIVYGTTAPTYPTSPCVGLPAGFALRAPVVSNEYLLGRGTLFDAGVAVYGAWPRYNGTNTDRFEIQQNAASAGGTANITTTSPFTWGAGDAMEYDVVIKMAA